MKTNYLIKAMLICLFAGFISNASGQSIATLANFTAANANITDLSQIICNGKNVQLSVPTTAGVTYVWETRFPSPDGTGTGVAVATNTGNVTDLPTTAGFYTYKLKATTTATGCSEIYDQVVFVMPSLTLTVTPPATLAACTNASTTPSFAFTSAISNNTAAGLTFDVDYKWFSKKGTDAEVELATTQNYTVSTAAEGAYQVYARATFKVKDTCAPAESAKTTINITTPPTKPVITIASN